MTQSRRVHVWNDTTNDPPLLRCTLPSPSPRVQIPFFVLRNRIYLRVFVPVSRRRLKIEAAPYTRILFSR